MSRVIKIKNNKQKGSFLVELMVGLFMSVVSILGVMTIYANFEGQKRTTTQANEAISNAALALFPLQHYGKMAGYGVNNAALLGCNVKAYNSSKPAGEQEFDFSLTPILINAGASNAESDTIQFLFGESDSFFAPATITQTMPSPAALFKVDSRFGLREGDLLIAAEPGKDCSLSQISNLPSQQNQSDNVIKNAGNYTDPITGQQTPTTYNKPGGLGVSYSVGAKLFNLGRSPSILEFYVENNQMIQENQLATVDARRVIGDNILMLKAVYGIDSNDDGAVDNWTNVTPTSNADLARITGVRVAILARSNLRERAEDGACNITVNSDINWMNGTFDISGFEDWQCYRYRVLQTTIPIKNMIWRSSI